MSIGDFTVEHKQGYYTKQQYESKGVLLARITDLGNPKVNFCSMPKLDVSEKDYQAFKVCKGDFLFARSGAIGRYGIVNIEPPRTIFASYLIRFRFNEEVNSYYVGQVYESELTQAQIKAISQGNANININAENIKKLKMLVPPLCEQQKIAEVLSTVDKKIDLIDQKIAETEKLKTGLMQKLFSEGVGVQDSDGNWQPHSEFRKSPIGQIPQIWLNAKIGDYVAELISGVSVNSYDKTKSATDIGVLKTSAVIGGRFYPELHKTIKPEDVSRAKTTVIENTLIISRMNTPALVGEFGYATKSYEDLYLPDRLWMTVPTDKPHDVLALSYLMQHYPIKKVIKGLATGTSNSMKNISKGKFLSVFIPHIPYEEQMIIREILSNIDSKLQLLTRKKSETQQLKKGLMQKLLTGEWRVPLDSTDAA